LGHEFEDLGTSLIGARLVATGSVADFGRELMLLKQAVQFGARSAMAFASQRAPNICIAAVRLMLRQQVDRLNARGNGGERRPWWRFW